jgi:CRISPR-associated protein Cas5d
LVEFDRPVEIKVWGEFACFTRPEMKVERVTYPVMTPSAARGVLEAIHWKPEFDWRVQQIAVLKPITYFSILRNEVKSRASERAARSWMGTSDGFFASENRAQRNTLALADVAYVIRATIEPREGGRQTEAKHRDQFRRRVAKGQCFAQPYLGTREFTASFSEPDGGEQPIPLDLDLGRMLLDLDYATDGSGDAKPRFFNAALVGGVLTAPAFSETAV